MNFKNVLFSEGFLICMAARSPTQYSLRCGRFETENMLVLPRLQQKLGGLAFCLARSDTLVPILWFGAPFLAALGEHAGLLKFKLY